MTKPRRRKGKPFDPATAHDRRSSDLLRNAQVAPVEVTDPYGDKIIVMRSNIADPLADMHGRKLIDYCDYVAGRHWQAARENAEIGGIRAIDPGKEQVDGGRLPEVLSDRQRRAVVDIRNATKALGAEGDRLIRDILGRGLTIAKAAAERGSNSEADRKYLGRRFRECLACLAELYGLANSKLVKEIEE